MVLAPTARAARQRISLSFVAISAVLAITQAPMAAAAVSPTAVDDAYTVDAVGVFTSPAGAGLKSNDLGIGVPGVTIQITRQPSFGTVGDVWLDGQFSYEPRDGYVGIDTFTYCLRILTDPCTEPDATVTMTVKSVLERIAGADRYIVSAAVSATKFSPSAPVVYVASGEVFPDALSASAVAGAQGAPVLLTGRQALPPAVHDELVRLQPKRIVVVGGTATIDPAVELQLNTLAPEVTRIGGDDRYSESALLSQSTFKPNPARVFIASGEQFPDALSASAAAGKTGGPVLLVGRDSVPAAVAAELRRLKPAAVQFVGGVDTLSEAVRAEIDQITGGTSTRIGGSDRYDVAVGVLSKYFLSVSTPTVYIASGAVFPDALSGSAAAIKAKAPILLVSRDSVRGTVLDQLDRLRPARIVVLGGVDTISPSVSRQLEDHLR